MLGRTAQVVLDREAKMFRMTLLWFTLYLVLPVALPGQVRGGLHAGGACRSAVALDPSFDLTARSAGADGRLARFADSITIWSPMRPDFVAIGYTHGERSPDYRWGIGDDNSLLDRDSFNYDSVITAMGRAVRQFQGRLSDSALTIGLLRFVASGSQWGTSSARQQDIVLDVLNDLNLEAQAWVLVGFLTVDPGLRYRAFVAIGAGPEKATGALPFRSAFRSVCQILLAYQGFDGAGDASDVLPRNWLGLFDALIHWLDQNWNSVGEEQLGCTRATCFASFEPPNAYARRTAFVWKQLQ